ncbi:hypothetical protein SERLA73DRAFT_126702 [Serpula lacrymans var. lacrymans S7.3]|uniref:Uncharacterized protein n=2 Tax=Serpula lacrymans var. lacrymans TaxID=341189 RepID=F8QEE5_SERL3|nr:uncharacterized protein SERLADRAFT_374946 [Serpula lacrymans var. lacrymans S7.9]EGN93201.1 hypothetical protein SERLA73DRAFT_126702 [Serpula lacrymans var. lacrymans S7.3]EGO18527.1 hypothetical protein SERLADRAFT_374946 [Serpula lacrymans var. lacrymans S7.9]
MQNLIYYFYQHIENIGASYSGSPEPSLSFSNEPDTLQLDDIKIEFYPQSGYPEQTVHFEEFGHEDTSAVQFFLDKEPWRPFAEFMLEAALSKAQTDKLISLVHRCMQKEGGSFTFTNHADVHRAWDSASRTLTPFVDKPISVPYKNGVKDFVVYYRPLWDWALDLLQDACLAPHFEWDAKWLYKYNGESFVQFYHEPWTANRWWDIQLSLPEGGKPFCFIIYADKSKLSLFGTEKGYPVVARCANLPVRNSDGVGGGCVVGWLPVVAEDQAESGKQGYVNFKCIVWHEAFYILLKTITAISKTGFQCIMSLIRGIGSKCPCPVCYVPAEMLSDLSLTFPLRTAQNSRAVFQEANGMMYAEEKEKLTSFWKVANSDPHLAISFDPLHAYSAGLWGNHIWSEIKNAIDGLSKKALEKVDNQSSLFPCWPNLNHFEKITGISFSDGSKLEDIAKITIFVSHNVLQSQDHPEGYLLLQCLRSYLNLAMYIGFDVHTDKTIDAGQRELLKFSLLLQMSKNWNFPKAHTHKHAFDDIIAKGATQNYNTKPNEKLHGPLKKLYALQMNGKQVTQQILKIDHWSLVSTYIRTQIDILDTSHEPPTDNLETVAPSNISNHITFGSPQVAVTLGELETSCTNTIFKDFRKRLSTFMTDFLPAYGIPFPEGKGIKFLPSDLIKEYRYLKVSYESTVDWQEAQDYLCCSPNFHGHERRDSVIIQTVNGEIFARLLFLFVCTVDKVQYPLAMIQPFDSPTGVAHRKDKALGLIRVRARSQAACEFVSIHSIIWGALIVEDFSKVGDSFVVGVVDGDMFLRLQHLRQI